MTHADAVREAKERVVECACIETKAERAQVIGGSGVPQDAVIWDCANARQQAVDEYEALVAQTCGTCGGSGKHPRKGKMWTDGDLLRFDGPPCPAACDNGKRTAALSPSSDGSKEADRD